MPKFCSKRGAAASRIERRARDFQRYLIFRHFGSSQRERSAAIQPNGQTMLIMFEAVTGERKFAIRPRGGA